MPARHTLQAHWFAKGTAKENGLSPPRKKTRPDDGLSRSPLAPLNPPIEETAAEPAATRDAAARAEGEAEAAVVAAAVGALSPSALGAHGAQLSSEQIAAIVAGHAAAPAKAEPLFTEVTRTLPTAQRAQLASAAVQERSVPPAMALPPSTALGVARAAAAKLGESEVLALLDAISERAPFEYHLHQQLIAHHRRNSQLELQPGAHPRTRRPDRSSARGTLRGTVYGMLTDSVPPTKVSFSS